MMDQSNSDEPNGGISETLKKVQAADFGNYSRMFKAHSQNLAMANEILES